MKILLTGRNGQVGWELEQLLPVLGEVVATDRSTLDLSNVDQIRKAVSSCKPDVIVNAAAYTAVDKAEAEPGLAMRVNCIGPRVLAEEAARLGALLVHFSTDYVFDGEKGRPYLEDDAPGPLGAYGRSKLAGERAIRDAGCRHLVLRTSWVYSGRCSNFLLTMLRLAREGAPLRVVYDQIGTPTWARTLAKATLSFLRAGAPQGTYHATCSGATSWHGFASEIMMRARLPAKVIAVRSTEFPRPARRPKDSRLDNRKLAGALGAELPEWRVALRDCVAQMHKG